MKLRRSTKLFLYKVLHFFLIIALILPLLPRPGLAQPLPRQEERGISVEEAFALLNAEIESYLPASEHPFGFAGQQASSSFDPSVGVPTSPWEMLPDAPQTGEREGDNGSGSFLPQPLDPNAQNAALLESIMPMLVDMPGMEGEKAAQDGTKTPDKGDKTAQLPPEAPVGTTPEALTPQPPLPIIGEGEPVGMPGPNGVVRVAERGRDADSESEVYLPFVAHEQASSTAPDVITFDGGTYHSSDEQLMVIVPEQVLYEPVRLSYTSGLGSLRGAAALSEEVINSHALFALEAYQVSDKAPVEQVRRPVELRLRYDDAGISEQEEPYLRLHAYNEATGEWQALTTAVDGENNTIRAWSVYFTTFALAVPYVPIDPCAIATQLAPEYPITPAPRTSGGTVIPQGTFHNSSTSFNHYVGTEVYLSGDDTGDAQKSDPTALTAFQTDELAQITFPEGAWSNGGDDVTSFYPALPPLTRLQPHSISTQLQHFTKATWGSSEYWLIRKDILIPYTLRMYSYHDGAGGANIYVKARDNCAVGQVWLTFSNNDVPGYLPTRVQMEYMGGAPDGGTFATDGWGWYRSQIQLPTTGLNRYLIEVYDMAAYSAEPIPNFIMEAYTEQASSSRGYGDSKMVGQCTSPACDCTGTLGCIGDPVNTASGNFTHRETDLTIPGIGDTDIVIERSYNSLDSERYPALKGDPREPVGPFGIGWTSPFNFHLEIRDPLPLVGAGVKVNYPDGHSARYQGTSGTLTPLTPGESDILVASGGGYVLTEKDLTEYHFDGQGRLSQIMDANGNTQTYTQGANGPTQITNSAGRTINLTYNGDGLITAITGPEGLNLQYSYSGLVLTSFTDERGQTTTYSYDGVNHLTKMTTPKGHDALQLIYTGNGRVQQQRVGANETHSMAYDDTNYRRTLTDSEGNSEIHQYDANFRLLSVQDARGYTEAYTYNAQDLRASLIDKEGRTWSYSYDGRSNLLRTDGPLGWSVALTYNAQDRPLTMTDAEGRTTNFAYDGAGNLTSITNADGKSMSMTYDRGLLATITDFNGHTMVNTYDAAGDLVQVQNAEGEVLTIAYDGLGRMNSMTTHEGSTFSFAYDSASDLLASLSGPLGYSMGYTYDANGNLESETDARGNTTSYEYDGSENLLKVTDALNGIMTFTYDSMNNLLTESDELGQVTSYKYDETYNQIEMNAPESRKTTYTYDGMGNLTTSTDAEGRVTTLTYDELDRLVKMTDALGGETSMTYDKVGNLTSINDPNGHVTTYQIDVLDRIVRQTNAENEVTQYEYDNNGNLIAQVDAESNRTELTHDAVNRVVSISNAENETITFAYDSLGNIVDLVQAHNVPIRWQYDALYRTTKLIQNFVSTAPSSSDTNVTYQFAYDLNDNLTEVTDPLNNKSQFEYDKLNRLTKDRNALGDAIVYVYDAADNLTSVTDRRGHNTTLAYDDANRLSQVTDALNGTSTYAYDRVDNLTSYTDENNHATTLEYDDLNRLKKASNPENHAVELVYDAVGNVTQFIDARSASMTLEYDDVNRLIKGTDALNGETELLYDEVGNVTQVTDPNNHVTTIAYDLAYRTTSVTDAENYVTRFEYDDNSNVTTVVDGNANRTVVEYDKLDRIIGLTNAESEKTSYTYDPIGNLIDLIEADGVTKRYGYDDIYQLTSVTLNHGGTGTAFDTDILYQYGYDENGNLASISDALTHLTAFEYDELNRMTRETNPLAKTWAYQYDAADNLTQRVDANNKTTTYAYYDDNQLQTIQYDDGTSVGFSYDENNNLTQMVDSLGTTSLAYDQLNRISSVHDALGRSLAYGYDPVGNQTSITYPHGGTVQYAYFDNNWLQTMTDTAGRVTTYKRDSVGQMTRTLFSNGAVAEAVYDNANRLLSITHTEDSGELITRSSYTLNDVGLRTSAEIAYGRPWPKTVSETYTYDKLRRLTGVSDSLGFAAIYDYDQAGNRTSFRANDDQTTQVANDAFEITYSYNEANQLLTEVRGNETTTHTYDGNGNRTNEEWVQTGHPYKYGTDYSYDREDRLTNALNYRINDSLQTGHRRNKEETVMTYDGIGRRLNKEYIEHDGRGRMAMTEYVFDGLDIVAEYPVWEQGELIGRNNHRNEFYKNDEQQIVSQRRFPNGVEAQNYTYHYDGRMNVVSLTEETNRAWVHYQYDAYGQQLPEWGNLPHPEYHDHNRFRFSGQEWDDHTQTYSYFARHYQPEIGLWQSLDPLRGELQLPDTLNRYTYVTSNPINAYDLLGFKGFSFGSIGRGILGGIKSVVKGVAQGVSNWASGTGSVLTPTITSPVGGCKLLVNGIRTAKGVAQCLANKVGIPIYWNPSHGTVADLVESGLGKLTGTSSISRDLAQLLQNSPHISHVIAHSQGTIITSNALTQLVAGSRPSLDVSFVGAAVHKFRAQLSVLKATGSFGNLTDFAVHPLDPINLVSTLNPIRLVTGLVGGITQGAKYHSFTRYLENLTSLYKKPC